MSADELDWAQREARKRKASLSSIMTEALRERRQTLARARLLERLGTIDVTDADVRAVMQEWAGSA